MRALLPIFSKAASSMDFVRRSPAIIRIEVVPALLPNLNPTRARSRGEIQKLLDDGHVGFVSAEGAHLEIDGARDGFPTPTSV